MDKFLPHQDDLGKLIESRSVELFNRLSTIDVDQLGMPHHCLHYFKTSHSKRLFFSIETSAHILYHSISLIKKQPSQLIIMDYGAGVGTLFLLAKMIGCGQVIYSDHLEDWRKSAESIANAISVYIDHYIVGDIEDCLDRLEKFNIRCDLVTSRNVIEHIYKLDQFYSAIHRRQPQATVFSSTTANRKNPASVLKHWLWHRKWEKIFIGKRLIAIDRLSPGIPLFRKRELARATRGLAAADLKNAVDEYRKSGRLPNPRIHGTNTCDPENGVWAEHLIDIDTYRKLINEKHFAISFAPGFWDTHYRVKYLNNVARFLNRMIAKTDGLAFTLAPFIYVIASPKKEAS